MPTMNKIIIALLGSTLILAPLGTANASIGKWERPMPRSANGNGRCLDRQMGTAGNQPGGFHVPLGLDADNGGFVYATDSQNHRIQKFDAEGILQTVWGQEGAGPGEFHAPSDLAVSVSGAVYVADTGNHRIQVFLPDGAYAESWGRAKASFVSLLD